MDEGKKHPEFKIGDDVYITKILYFELHIIKI